MGAPLAPVEDFLTEAIKLQGGSCMGACCGGTTVADGFTDQSHQKFFDEIFEFN
jgi:hypothetical protein